MPNWMLRSVLAALCALGMAGAPVAVRATEAIVLGDSIGVGIATTIGFKHVAKRSFSLRRGDVASQLAQIPPDRIGLMSLGLNDAADPVEHLTKSIEKVIDAAGKVDRKLVWLGPPCVIGKKWDGRAEQLDQHLKQRLAQTTIQYVSLRDEKICSPGLRTRDGEHFTTEGYRYVWERIRRESAFAATIALDPCEKLKAESAAKGIRIADCSAAGGVGQVAASADGPKRNGKRK